MKKDLRGKTFGDLLVLDIAEVSRNGHYRYLVRCNCGVVKTLFGTHMISGKTKHCGCKTPRNSSNWQGYKGVGKTYWSSLKRGANGEKGRAPIEFDLSLKFIGDLLESQDYKCNLSGLPISCLDKTASLDRTDSSKGYTEDNVQWVEKDINMMKRHYTQDYFIYLCKAVASGGTCEIVDLT